MTPSELGTLTQLVRNFSSADAIAASLQQLKGNLSGTDEELIQLHDLLLFIQAYPMDENVYHEAGIMLQELVLWAASNLDRLFNSGISGSMVCAQFGLLLNEWLLTKNLTELDLEEVDGEGSDLVTRLTATLDPVEQELMPDKAGYFNHWQARFMNAQISKADQLKYLIHASLDMGGSIASREGVFAGFGLYTRFRLDPDFPGLSMGRLAEGKIQTHASGLQKRFTLEDAFSLGSPQQVKLHHKQKKELVELARGSMASLLRETDTFTYAQIEETELHDMGSGIQIGLFFMIEEQKFSMQSYVGFLLFKNRVPTAYGGCWLFASQAAFGVNVLPPFRGGESARIIGELLRLYHFRFGIGQFTVDPYQIGKGNEDGIQSGAFWFYYKLGFRPLQQRYIDLATKEKETMQLDTKYRSSAATLRKLANSELYYQVPGNEQPYYPLETIGKTLSIYLSQMFEGRRSASLAAALKVFKHRTGKRVDEDSFFCRVWLLWMSHGAADKLSAEELVALEAAYSDKGKKEAKTHLKLQKLGFFRRVFC